MRVYGGSYPQAYQSSSQSSDEDVTKAKEYGVSLFTYMYYKGMAVQRAAESGGGGRLRRPYS